MGTGEILKHWNARFGVKLPLSEAALQTTFFSWPSTSLHQMELQSGWLLCKQDADQLRVHLAIPKERAAVDEFCADAAKSLRGRALDLQCRRIVFGGGEEHLFPGVPLMADETHGSPWFPFFSASGPEVMDFQGNVEVLAAKAQSVSASGRLLSSHSSEEKQKIAEFVSREFPGRWAREISKDFKNNFFDSYFAYFLDGEMAGYVRLYGWNPSYWGPGVYFSGPGRKQGGLGPIGVAAARRNRGIGKQILKTSWELLRAKGISKVRVDWTTETTFYLERGLEIVQKYQPAFIEV